jgi:uncharacterized protein (DUF433 family)
MIELPETVVLPLSRDASGVILVSSTRVTLDTIIARYHQGDTPEAIHEGFPTVPLTDIYAVIAYYLAHQAEVDAYIARRDAERERLRQEIEASYTPEQKARTAYFRELIEKKRQENQS